LATSQALAPTTGSWPDLALSIHQVSILQFFHASGGQMTPLRIQLSMSYEKAS